MRKKKILRTIHNATKAIHLGSLSDPVYGEVSTPIFQNATFAFSNADEAAARFSGKEDGYIYSRLNNPTVNALEECIAGLENGFKGIATASGMAAVTSVFLAFLDKGAHVVASETLYSASRLSLENEFSRFGVTARFVNTSDLNAAEAAMQANTRLIFIETPANPTMEITDIEGAATIAHRFGALLVVDNTFASPFLQRPINLGADIVVHSCTKFINGHSDVLGGMIVSRTDELHQKVRSILNIFGAIMDPHQAWLILRGVRTLALRVEKAQENALKMARFLANHPKVTWIRYPGLPDHPQHEIAKKQMDGFGAMLCFGVKHGLEGGKALMNNLRLIPLAVSLGGVESLIEHPASMTHAGVPYEERMKSGIRDDLVRLSVGCEEFEDLREDLDQALKKVP